MARSNDPLPTPNQRRADHIVNTPTPQTEHDRHAAANAEQVRLLRAHLNGEKPC